MSVAEDGHEQEQPRDTPRRADRSARHRVPPTASATAKVPLLPEPFNPAKPTFPAGAAIPRQRRGGPTAIATASIPVVPVTDDEPDFFAGFGDPEEAGDDVLVGDADGMDNPGDPGDPDESGDMRQVDGPDEVDDDPATVGTLAGEIRASTAEPPAAGPAAGPVALGKPFVEAPGLVDPAGFAAAGLADPAPATPAVAAAPVAAAAVPVAAAAAVPVAAAAVPVAAQAAVPGAAHAAAPVAAHAAEPGVAADGGDGPVDAPDAQPVGVAQVVVTADDSPTVADYVPPAIAIVSDDPVDEDGPDYRGARRRVAAWRRYPVGAVAVAVLILLVTAAVVLQLVRSTGNPPAPVSADASPQRYPGVGGLPELTKDATSPAPSSGASSASASPSRSRSSAPAVPPPSASASPSKSTASPTPPPAALSGQLRGAGSGKCLEYRSGEGNRAVIDNCDPRGSGRTNQRWTFQADGSVRADGGCLDVQNAGTANQTPVRLFACNGTPAQRWTLRADGTLQNPNSKRCLDVQNGGTGAGSPIIIWDCTGAPNQKWAVQAY